MVKHFAVAWMLLLSFGMAAANADIQNQAGEIIRSAGLTGATVSVTAVDLTTGEQLVAIRADEPMIPASNMKLITTAAAMVVLGHDFTFETQLQLVQTPGGETVLIVKGDGDPAFGDPQLLEQYAPQVSDFEGLLQVWVDAVADAGVTRVDRLLVDDRIFDRDFVHPSWQPSHLPRWYAAQVAGFNFFGNCWLIQPHPTRVGEAPAVRVQPTLPDHRTTNRAVTIAGNQPTFGVDRRQGSNDLIFMGNVPRRGTGEARVTIHDPPATFAQIFAHRLGQRGIAVQQTGLVGPEDFFEQPRIVHRVRTPLISVINRANKNSQNMFTDALLKRSGRAYTGAPGSWQNGAAAFRAFLSERALGPAAAAAITIADGSGLSRDNRVTTRTLVELLAFMHRHPTYSEPFRNSLAIAGQDGTLSRRLHTDITGQVYAKTGYISRVSSLSGYLVLPVELGEAGETLAPQRVIAFSIIINDSQVSNADMHRLQDSLVRLLDRTVAHRRLGASR